MADRNSWTLDVRSWIDPREWDKASRARRDRFLNAAAVLIRDAKRRQVLKGVGADGEPLEPRIRPRADGADGKPLSPHRVGSRSYKWARTSVAYLNGSVTVWWSHGWGRILGYHARGEVMGTYLRNVIGFPPGVLSWLKGQARKLWPTFALRPRGTPSPQSPAPAMPAPSAPAVPRAPSPVVPVAAKPNPPGRIFPEPAPKVIYLKPGQKPNPRSKDIQVIT